MNNFTKYKHYVLGNKLDTYSMLTAANKLSGRERGQALKKLHAHLKDVDRRAEELEAFVNAALKADMVAVTADGEVVQAGDTVYMFSITGALKPTTVQELKAVTNYELFGKIPVAESFSSEQAALNYQKYQK